MPKEKVAKKSVTLRHDPMGGKERSAGPNNNNNNHNNASNKQGQQQKQRGSFGLSKSNAIKGSKAASAVEEEDNFDDEMVESEMPTVLGSKIYQQARDQLREESLESSAHARLSGSLKGGSKSSKHVSAHTDEEEDDEWEDDAPAAGKRRSNSGDSSDGDDMVEEEEDVGMDNSLAESINSLIMCYLIVLRRRS
jgi:hypothetical protein